MQIVSLWEAATCWAFGVKVRIRIAADALIEGFERIVRFNAAICSVIARQVDLVADLPTFRQSGDRAR